LFLNSLSSYVCCCFMHVVVILLVSVVAVRKSVILFQFTCIWSLSIYSCTLMINYFYTRNVEKTETMWKCLSDAIWMHDMWNIYCHYNNDTYMCFK
jgi:hypothetical protein